MKTLAYVWLGLGVIWFLVAIYMALTVTWIFIVWGVMWVCLGFLGFIRCMIAYDKQRI